MTFGNWSKNNITQALSILQYSLHFTCIHLGTFVYSIHGILLALSIAAGNLQITLPLPLANGNASSNGKFESKPIILYKG